MTEFREIGGHEFDVTQSNDVASGEGATCRMSPNWVLPLAAIIAELKSLQRQRKFCIVQQSRADRSTESYIAGLLGYSPQLAEAERAKLFKQASAIRKMVEKGGGEDQPASDNLRSTVLSAVAPIILASAQGRDSFDKLRDQAEKRMRNLARTLPVFPWAGAVSGFGDLPLSVIVAEAGDLANYANPGKVWKRCGLAVINGERQRKKTDPEKAAAHLYNPRRRATVYADVGTPLFFAKAKNEYGVIYAARRAHTAVTHPEWTKAHSDNDARRYITKRLLRDLWQAWRAAIDTVPEKAIAVLPPADLPEAAD